MKPLAPNTLLQNRYLIVHLIGKGGMGEVYLAVDQRLGSAMALKRTTVGDDPMLAEAFEREAKTLANLRHPVLPKVSDHFLENDEQYLIMEHISGDDISQRLKTAAKPFPLNWVMFWADQLLEALTYLHSNEPPIIHRDIKPQNLKLTNDNHIVLLDFGLSKQALGQTRVTTSGSVVGYTPHYAPMEQIRGTGTDPRSDIYSFSATIYQILTNTVPPDALTRADGLLANLPDPIIAINELNPEVPKSISDIILKGMNISLEMRYESAREMQKELRKAFNKIQSSMSAETVAFNVDDVKIPDDPGAITQVGNNLTDEEVKPFTPELIEAVPLSDHPNQQIDVVEDVSYDKTEVIDSSQIPVVNTGEDLDATVQFDAQSFNAPKVEEDLVGMKTEVLLDNVLPSSTEKQVEENYSTNENFTQQNEDSIPSIVSNEADYNTNDNYELGENSIPQEFTTNEDFSIEAEEPSVDATVPLISFDGENVVSKESVQTETTDFSNLDSEYSDDSKEVAGATSTYGLTENVAFDSTESSENINENSGVDSISIDKQTTQTPPPVKQKSSNGKYVAILGGLGLLLFLVIGTAAGVGWYMYGGSGGTTAEDTNTSATPEPSVEPTPEVEVTPDVVENENNSNVEENTNSSELTETNTETNTETQSENTPTTTKQTTVTTTKVTPTPVRNTTPRPTPRIVTSKTPVVRKTPVVIQPKPTPKKGSRTDIIQ